MFNSYTKDILKISWPIIVGQLGIVLTGFFDNLMVAKLGHVELAAAGICNSIYFLLSIFPMGVTMAYATIVGLLQGKNRINSSHLLVKDSFKTTVLLSIITIIVLLVAVQYFHIFQQPEDVNVLSKPYLTLLTCSLTPMLLFFFAKNICDGFEYTQGGMIVTIIALLLNIFLNWIFIYGNLGSDAYGLNGAGYATIISRTFSAIAFVLLLFYSSNTPIKWTTLKASLKNKKWFSFNGQILKLGIPTGLQYFFEIAAFAFAAIMAGWLGSKELAAHQLAITLASLTYMFASGISVGSSINVAKSAGNKNYEKVKLYGINGHRMSVVGMTFFAIVFWIFNRELASMFSSDIEVITMGSQLLILAAIFQLGDGVQAVSVGLLRGLKDVNKPSIITFMVYWFAAVPVGYYLSQTLKANAFYSGVNGIWIGLTAGLTLSAIILTARFYILLRNK